MTMTINEKAAALTEMGMVRPISFDERNRITGVIVAARNLDMAYVRYERRGGIIYVASCDHVASCERYNHKCEGHSHGHVCYHSRAGLMMSAALAETELTFYGSEPEAAGGTVIRVVVPGHDEKSVWVCYKEKR